MLEIENEQRKLMCLKFHQQNLDDISRRDFGHHHLETSTGLGSAGLLQNSTQPVNIPSNSHLTSSLSGKFLCFQTNSIYIIIVLFIGLLQGTSAPVNIPDNNFSPNNGGGGNSTGGHSNLFGGPFGQLSGSAPKMNNSFSHTDNMFLQSHLISPVLNDTLSISPDLRYDFERSYAELCFIKLQIHLDYLN